MKFTKMQGIGNDYVYLDCVRFSAPGDPAALARKVSDRHFGIGSDGLVLILPGEQGDFRMRMFNADGSEAEMCGNASRCVGKYVYERGLTKKTDLLLETGNTVRTLRLNVKDGRVTSVRVDMGVPDFDPDHIPVNTEVLPLPIGSDDTRRGTLKVLGREFSVQCVCVGNPHCVVFMEDIDSLPLAEWGPKFETHPAFPRRINTEFAQILDRSHIRMRVWERGSGETMACGTGACAALAAAAAIGRADRRTKIELRGGSLEIEWKKESGHLWMSGPAEFVFDGELCE